MSVSSRSPLPDDSPPNPCARLAGWLADIAETSPHVLAHDGPCGERFACDNPGHRADGYCRVELLRNGYLLFHCEGLELRPGEPSYEPRRAGLVRREDLS